MNSTRSISFTDYRALKKSIEQEAASGKTLNGANLVEFVEVEPELSFFFGHFTSPNELTVQFDSVDQPSIYLHVWLFGQPAAITVPSAGKPCVQQLCLLSATDTWQFVLEPKQPCTWLSIAVPRALLEQYMPIIDTLLGWQLQAVHPLLIEAIDRFRQALYPKWQNNLMARTAFYKLLHQLLGYVAQQATTPQILTNVTDQERLERVRQEMTANLGQKPLSLQEAADQSNMSISKFKELFRRLYAKSYYQYYQDIRGEKAMSLLRDQQCTIAEVSTMLGFINPSKFIVFFKSLSGGLTPGQYRAQYIPGQALLNGQNHSDRKPIVRLGMNRKATMKIIHS